MVKMFRRDFSATKFMAQESVLAHIIKYARQR